MKQSVSGVKMNTVWLQEKEKNVAEETNDDYDENAEANEIIDKNKGMVVTLKEEKKT